MKKCTLSDIMFYSMDGLNSTYVIIRFELDHTIRKDIMSKAYEHTSRRFPYFQTKLQKLDSGFVLIPNENPAIMHEDHPEYVLNATENDGFLYRFSVWNNTISFSFFHGLTDGTGANIFMKVILTEYYIMLGENVVPAKDIYHIDVNPVPEETAEPLDNIPNDIIPAPYKGSVFYHIPEKPVKEAVSYTFSASALQIMDYATLFDGSPNAIAAIIMAKAIHDIHQDALKDGIDIGISINAKPIIGLPKSHWPFLQTSTFHFDEKVMEMDEEFLHTCVRGKIFADCTKEKLLPALAGVRSLGSIFEYIKDDRARKLLCLKSTESPRCTATVSYTGKSDFGSIGKHINGIYTFCDSCVPILEINYNDGVFYFSLSSHIDSKVYAEKIREHFNKMNFQCSELNAVHFHMAEGKKDRPRFGMNLPSLRLISGIRAYKKDMISKKCDLI